MNRATFSEKDLIRLGVSGVESMAHFRFHEARYQFLIQTIVNPAAVSGRIYNRRRAVFPVTVATGLQ